MKNYKEQASWLPKAGKFIKQITVSFVSYITLPVFKEKEDGIRDFFKRNYYIKSDELVFDGTSTGYFLRIKNLLDISMLSDKVVLDLGCGRGSLLHWLQKNRISFKKYIGIDFSVKTCTINQNCVMICDNIKNIKNYLSDEQSLIVMCNSLCYTDTEIFINILDSIQPGNGILIIEPAPNIFWDAHFDGIKPIYRTLEKTCSLLSCKGFVIENTMSDYLFAIGSHYFGKLSYGIYAYKNAIR